MASKESQVAAQVRLRQWALEIQECQNRPKDMTVEEWCSQHNITKANYYWRLKRVRQAVLEQMEVPATSFVELPVPASPSLPASIPEVSHPVDSTVAVLHLSGGITIEIKEQATSGFIRNLIGAIANA